MKPPTLSLLTNSPFAVLCQYPIAGGSGFQVLAIDPSAVLNYTCSTA